MMMMLRDAGLSEDVAHAREAQIDIMPDAQAGLTF